MPLFAWTPNAEPSVLNQKQVGRYYIANARDFTRAERVRERRLQRRLDRLRAPRTPVRTELVGLYTTIRTLLATPTPAED